MNKPHRPNEADFRSNVPFSGTGMRLFNGLGCSVSCSTQATSFRKATWSSRSVAPRNPRYRHRWVGAAPRLGAAQKRGGGFAFFPRPPRQRRFFGDSAHESAACHVFSGLLLRRNSLTPRRTTHQSRARLIRNSFELISFWHFGWWWLRKWWWWLRQ